jgi:hypothetical protein
LVVPPAPPEGVYVKVCGVAALPEVNVKDDGVNVPPPLESLRTIVSFAASGPLRVTV